MPIEDKVANWYRKHGQEPPTSQSHELTPEDIRERVKPLKPTNWRLEGNKLTADTPMGPLVNYLPTNVIMTGTDDKGLPTLKRIDKS